MEFKDSLIAFLTLHIDAIQANWRWCVWVANRHLGSQLATTIPGPVVNHRSHGIPSTDQPSDTACNLHAHTPKRKPMEHNRFLFLGLVNQFIDCQTSMTFWLTRREKKQKWMEKWSRVKSQLSFRCTEFNGGIEIA